MNTAPGSINREIQSYELKKPLSPVMFFSTMLVICDSCRTKYRITIKKAPGKTVTFKCGKCQNRIRITPEDLEKGVHGEEEVSAAPEKKASSTVRVNCSRCGNPFVKQKSDDNRICQQCKIEAMVSQVKNKYGVDSRLPEGAVAEEGAKYTIRTADGLVLGPIKLNTVKSLAKEKKIKGLEEVKKDDADYLPLMTIPELAELFPEMKELVSTDGLEDKVDAAFMTAFGMNGEEEEGPSALAEATAMEGEEPAAQETEAPQEEMPEPEDAEPEEDEEELEAALGGLGEEEAVAEAEPAGPEPAEAEIPEEEPETTEEETSEPEEPEPAPHEEETAEPEEPEPAPSEEDGDELEAALGGLGEEEAVAEAEPTPPEEGEDELEAALDGLGDEESSVEIEMPEKEEVEEDVVPEEAEIGGDEDDRIDIGETFEAHPEDESEDIEGPEEAETETEELAAEVEMEEESTGPPLPEGPEEEVYPQPEDDTDIIDLGDLSHKSSQEKGAEEEETEAETPGQEETAEAAASGEEEPDLVEPDLLAADEEEVGTEFDLEGDFEEPHATAEESGEESGETEVIEGLEPVPEPPPDARYRIRYPDGLMLGPVKIDTIRELFSTGNLTGQEEIQREDDEWRSMADLPEFMDLIAAGEEEAGDDVIELAEVMEE